MTRPGKRISFFLPGLILFVFLMAGVLPGGIALDIIPVKSEKQTPYLTLPLNPGERFTLHYYHSVENAPIWEEHSLDAAGRIFIEEERYEKFGAGMGKMPGVGRLVTKGKYEAIVDMHMPVGKFILRVGSLGVDHTVIWRGKQFNLSKTFAHQALLFTGRPVSMLGRVMIFLNVNT